MIEGYGRPQPGTRADRRIKSEATKNWGRENRVCDFRLSFQPEPAKIAEADRQHQVIHRKFRGESGRDSGLRLETFRL